WIMPVAAQEQYRPIAPDPATEVMEPTAWSRAVQSIDAVARVITPAPDLDAVLAEDAVRDSAGEPPRFAVPNPVLITPSTAGTWEAVDEHTQLWRLRITCPDAQSINLGFTRYFMPPGGQLMVYSVDGSERTRAFTSIDNFDHGELWTPVVLSDDIVVELTIPESELGDLQLELGAINHGYRFFHKPSKDDGGPRAPGYCEIDIICPAADGWRTEIPAIGVYTVSGIWTCTGSMINNTSQNQTPYFLTAYHCGVTSSNASAVVVYWNYYSPTCGAHGGGSLSQSQSGSTFRARWSSSDFCLLQLNAAPSSAWGITFAGWDRSDANFANPVGIHHPDCAEKSISFTTYSTAITSQNSDTSPGTAMYLKVTWLPPATNQGVTEPGSSGSPLFNQSHRIVGQLWGGQSACGASDMRDWYGRIFKSWTGNGTDSTRLSNWLDPTGTGATYVDTLNPSAGMAVTPSDGLASSGAVGGPFSPSSKVYTLTNQGSSSINYTVSKTASWLTLSSTGGTLAAGANTTVTVSVNSNANSLSAGTYNDTVTFTNTTNHQGDTTRSVTLQVLPAMSVTPTDGLTSSGSIGGPFSPSSKVYTVLNASASSINYTVGKTASWVSLSGAGGSLAAGASTTVTVSINSNANSLAVGSYSDTVTFTNTTNHQGDTTRAVSLTVNPLSNDLCANAFVACPGTTYTGTTVGMAQDGTATCGSSTTTPDVWYKYTPATGGSATFSLCGSGTTYDSVLSVRSGTCASSTQLGCDDDGCGTTGGPSTVTATVTAGTTYLIRVSGYNGRTGAYSLTITGPACQSSDTDPPTPNPMTFASAPAPAGTGSITMTATTATDATTPPVSYYFDFVTGGSGGTDSSWQSSTTYTDSGLAANTSYTYAVKARDSAATPNETSYSANNETATLIETPTGVTFGTVTNSSIVLNAGGAFTNLTTDSSGLYFDSTTTGGDGGINAWVQTTTDTATSLSPDTSYTFQVKARNQNSVETAYGSTASKVTLANVPTAPTLSGATRTTLGLNVNANGNPTATVFAVQCTAAAPSDSAWVGKYVSATGTPSASAVWRTDAQWGTTTVTGLESCTSYTFAVKARNSESVETAFGAGASLSTTGDQGDLTADGVVDGEDIQVFVTCTVGGGDGCGCANLSVSAFVSCLLDAGTCP
ncbi:MAG: trypsin-like peptidase domain-containing protein, partial [Opitutaceae bacterium]|nr:trypsin-like peptidase domain-containing protein [Opitutaceae bacterium]